MQRLIKVNRGGSIQRYQVESIYDGLSNFVYRAIKLDGTPTKALKYSVATYDGDRLNTFDNLEDAKHAADVPF